jgi:hypothetical protein
MVMACLRETVGKSTRKSSNGRAGTRVSAKHAVPLLISVSETIPKF